MAVREKSIEEVAQARGSEVKLDQSATGRRDSLPEYESVIDSCSVSLDQLIEASRVSRARSNKDERSRMLYGSYLPRLRQAYEDRNGEIEESFVAQNIDAGALLVRVPRKSGLTRKKKD